MTIWTNHGALLRACPVPGSGIERYSVLLLEDDEFQREVVVARLAGLGVRNVITAASGDEALAALEHARDGIDVVICDLQMTDETAMDGVEFLRRARHMRIGSLILMSGLASDIYSCAESLARSYGLPLTRRLEKPVDVIALRDALLASRPLAPTGARTDGKRDAHVWAKADLLAALRKDQFNVHFQPQVDMATGRFSGVEALARWEHPTLGMIPPSQFIPLMETELLIDDLMETVYRKTLDAMKRWPCLGQDVRVAINASSLTLQSVEVPNRFRAIAREHGVDTSRLTIELTETALANEADGLLESLTRLRMHGFQVSLDDFGTGYASLHQLGKMPFTEVKIDRSFAAALDTGNRSVAILDAIISLSHRLRLKIVAEGIESDMQADFLRAAGCDVGQGYYFGRPVRAEALNDWCASQAQGKARVRLPVRCAAHSADMQETRDSIMQPVAKPLPARAL